MIKNLTQKVGSELIWLWVDTMESESKEILGISVYPKGEICLC